MTKKCHPELIHPAIAERAMQDAITVGDKRTTLFTHYIMLHYRSTGKLAPGCDFKDLLAWYEVNMPDELTSVTKS